MMYERMMMHMLTRSNKLIYIIYNAFEIPKSAGKNQQYNAQTFR